MRKRYALFYGYLDGTAGGFNDYDSVHRCIADALDALPVAVPDWFHVVDLDTMDFAKSDTFITVKEPPPLPISLPFTEIR